MHRLLHSIIICAALGAARAEDGYRLWLRYDRVADVANSIINMLGTAVIITVILLSPALAKKFGKKAVAVAGFALTTLASLAFYLPSPGNVGGMLLLTVVWSVCYAPTIQGV